MNTADPVGGSARQVAANHELGSEIPTPPGSAYSTGEAASCRRRRPPVGGRFALATCAGRARAPSSATPPPRPEPSPSELRPATIEPRSRTFHSPPDQSRTKVKLVFIAAAPTTPSAERPSLPARAAPQTRRHFGDWHTALECQPATTVNSWFSGSPALDSTIAAEFAWGSRCLAARGSSGGAEKVRRLGLVVGGWVRGGGT